MNILVDGYNLALPKGTGIATYGRGFIAATKSLGHRVELLLGEELESRPAFSGPRALLKAYDLLAAPFGYRPRACDQAALASELGFRQAACVATWNRARLFRAAKMYFRRTGRFAAVHIPGIELAHWTYPLPLYVPGARNVYTVHDIVPIKFPWMISRGGDEYLRTCRAIVASGADVLTVSETSRDDILSTFDITPERVHNTFQAFDGRLTQKARAGDASWVRSQDLAPKGYLLFFGAIEPKKNVGRILDAFEASSIATPLVVVAAGGWGCDAEASRLKALAQRPDRRIRLYDYLERDKVVDLIRNAKATLFPSLYEGFGLPALESMAAGTAVIASGNASLREVVGDAGLLVDPLSVDSIRDAIRAIDSAPSLRLALEEKGRQRSLLFSPENYAARLAALFARWDD